MTLKECYNKIGGDYNDVLSRLLTEERVIKYCKKFLENSDYIEVRGAFEKEDFARAFELTHSIKGMCANMGFSRVFSSASELCESVRGGAPKKDVSNIIDAFYADYEITIAGLRELIG